MHHRGGVVMVVINAVMDHVVMAVVAFDHDRVSTGVGGEGGDADEGTAEGKEEFHRFVY